MSSMAHKSIPPCHSCQVPHSNESEQRNQFASVTSIKRKSSARAPPAYPVELQEHLDWSSVSIRASVESKQFLQSDNRLDQHSSHRNITSSYGNFVRIISAR